MRIPASEAHVAKFIPEQCRRLIKMIETTEGREIFMGIRAERDPGIPADPKKTGLRQAALAHQLKMKRTGQRGDCVEFRDALAAKVESKQISRSQMVSAISLVQMGLKPPAM